MSSLSAIQLLLLVAAIALVIVGSIRLVRRTVRFSRRHRGKVSTLRGWVTAALEDWVDEPESTVDKSHYDAEDEEIDATIPSDSVSTTDAGHSGDGSHH